jgi:predicted transcriptional regulator
MIPDGSRRTCRHLEVFMRILRALLNDDLKKTRLAWAGKVSYDALQIYLKILLLNELVILNRDNLNHEVIKITKKGRTLLNNYDTNFSMLTEVK